MSLLDGLKKIAGIGEKDLSLEEIQSKIAIIPDNDPKAEQHILKLVRRNITLKNDGALIAIVHAIPFSFRDHSNTDEYREAVGTARSAIRLKVMTILTHEEELNGLSIENIILNKETKVDIQYIIDMLKNREEFHKYGIDFPTGALFCGPP